MENFIIQDGIFLPLRNLTIFYTMDPLRIQLPGIKDYTFHMDGNEILEKFKMLAKQDRVLNAAKNILGFNSLEYDEKTETFKADNDISHKIHQLSAGTRQAIGICTIILNPMVFGAGEKSLLIRHPEASLHPKSQSAIGRLLVQSYMENTKLHGENHPRIFIETWSDHILNGIRVGTLQQKLDPNNFALNFIREGVAKTIWLSEKGEFSSWPEGFMDQYSKDLSELLGF